MATTVQLISPAEVAAIVPKVVAQANQIVIHTQDDYEMTASFLQLLATRKKEVEATFDPIIAKAHEAHKEACGQKKKFMDPLLDAEKTTKRKMIDFDTEQERLRQEQFRRDQEAARKKAEEEQAERERLAKIEADAKAAAALAEAAQLEAQGESHLAEIVLQTAAEEAAAPAPVVPFMAPVVTRTVAPKTDGIAKTEEWKWGVDGDEVSALKKLVRAAATDDRLLAYLAFNTKTIGSAVKSQKSLAKIPGITTWPEKGVKTTGR